ncbi:MFS transporter [Candidatus Dependentiae bacterium]
MKNNFFGAINKNILLLSLVSMLNDVSSEMITPILPLFLKAMGGSSVVIGVIGGLRDSIANILKVVSGYYSDKSGKRKIFVSSGYIFSAIFKFFIAISKTWQQLIVFSGLERIGKGFRDAPRDAIIAKYSTREQRGRIFGLHRTFDTTGAIIGSMFAFILLWIFGFSFKNIIMTASIIGIFSLIPLYFVKDTQETEKKHLTTIKFEFANFPKRLKLFFLVSGIFSLANFSYMFLILKAQEIFTGKLAITAPIFLYVLYNIFYATFAIPLGILYDKIGKKKVLILGYLIFCLTSLGFSFAKTTSQFIGLFILYGIFYATTEGNQRAYVANLAQKRLSATAIGTFYTITGILTLSSSIIAGYIWKYISSDATFLFGSITSFISIILFLICYKTLETPKSEITEK